jgi:hypothetical protein
VQATGLAGGHDFLQLLMVLLEKSIFRQTLISAASCCGRREIGQYFSIPRNGEKFMPEKV